MASVAIVLAFALVPPNVVRGASSITVDRTDDTAAANACLDATANDCSLRGAVAFANAHPGTSSVAGTTINIPAGLYQLTIAGSTGSETNGLCGNPSVGDLDVSGNNTTITGAGAASAIIRQTTSDRVICLNPLVVDDFIFHLSGVTITGGRDTTGVGGGGLVGGAYHNETYVSNCVFSNDQVSGAGFGGGAISSQGGNLSVTNCAFGGTNAPGPSQTDITLANSSGTSGGAIGYGAGDLNPPPSGGRPETGILTVTNSSFTNNVANSIAAGGGALDIFGFNLGTANANISATTFTGNHAPSAGGGAIVLESGTVTVDNSSFGTNTAGFNGGAIYSSGTMTVTKSTFTSNSVSSSTGIGGGAMGQAASGSSTVHFSRFVGNTAAIPDGQTVARATGGAGSTFDAANNWWGSSTGPGAHDGNNVSPITPFLQLKTSASPGTIVTNQTSSLTTSFNTNSAGTDVSANIDVLLGLGVTWSAVGGSISGAQSTIQTAGGGKGTATATYTATAAAVSNSATAVVDNGPSSGSTNTASITVNKANTTATVTNATSLLSTHSVTGQPVGVTYSVVGAFGNSPTAPTGTVTVSDGTDSCTGTFAAGTCNLTFKTAGSKTVTATYNFDSNFNSSPASTGAPHTVDKADTTTTITSDNPDPSVTGQTVTFQVAVAAVAPGAAVAPTTITGNVIVSDGGTNSCIATLAAGTGSCTIAFPAATSYSLTASYGGDSNFNGSATASSTAHTVNKADTTTTITSDSPDPSDVDTAITVAYTVSVDSPGAGTPTGNVTVGDGVDSCTATVGDGQCALTLTTPGARSLTATYAGDTNFLGSGSTPAEPHTVATIATTTAITSDSADPSVVGESVTVTYTVTSDSGSTTPTGNVTVGDGVDSCTATVGDGQCELTLTTPGTRSLTASYGGDTKHDPSNSAVESHLVNQADTTTSIMSDLPDPSAAGGSVTVHYTVTVSTPGSGTPTGSVTVTDGVDSCTATVADGQCSIALSTSGARSLTATYGGDANFVGSSSGSEPHTVLAADGSGTMATPTTSVPVGASGQTITFTYTAAGPMANGTVVLIVPGRWSAPSTAATDPGYATSSAGTLRVLGNWIIVHNLTLTAGQTLTITYGDTTGGGPGATAPATLVSQTWHAKQRSSPSGVRTELSSSPVIAIV